MERSLMVLKEKDFELAYLALLSLEKLKPICRYEKGLSEREFRPLQDLNLNPTHISRRLASGNLLKETIFGSDLRYINTYAKKFDGSAISQSRTVKRLEGTLFGYPKCCVEAFVEREYQANNLLRQDQEILFHWACKNCRVTPELLPKYRKIYLRILDLRKFNEKENPNN